jgi:hypothetical protein
MQTLEYPGTCAVCGKQWGDHLTELALDRNPYACRFVPLPGEIDKPRRKEVPDEPPPSAVHASARGGKAAITSEVRMD